MKDLSQPLTNNTETKKPLCQREGRRIKKHNQQIETCLLPRADGFIYLYFEYALILPSPCLYILINKRGIFLFDFIIYPSNFIIFVILLLEGHINEINTRSESHPGKVSFAITIEFIIFLSIYLYLLSIYIYISISVICYYNKTF